jgi:hypothetical protein
MGLRGKKTPATAAEHPLLDALKGGMIFLKAKNNRRRSDSILRRAVGG